MAKLNVVIVPAKVLKGDKHKLRIALSHNSETRYILTDIILSSEKELKNGQIVKRPDASILNTKVRNLLQIYQNRIDNVPFLESLSCSELVAIIKEKKSLKLNTLQEVFEEYQNVCRQRESTKMSWKAMWNTIIRIIGNKRLDTINIATIALLDKTCVEMGRKPNTVNTYMIILRTILNYAVDCGYVEYPASPFKRFRFYKTESRDSWLSVDQIIKIRDYDFSRHPRGFALMRDIFMLSFYLGGINSIDLFSMDFSTNLNDISYTRSKVHGRSSNCLPIKYNIPAEAKEIIERIAPEGKIQLYRKYTKNKLNFISIYMKKISVELRIENLVFYSARKSFAQQAHEIGISTQVIDYILGHSIRKSGSSIYHYVYVSPEMASAAIRKVLDCLK